jgi:hypothetical protein
VASSVGAAVVCVEEGAFQGLVAAAAAVDCQFPHPCRPFASLGIIQGGRALAKKFGRGGVVPRSRGSGRQACLVKPGALLSCMSLASMRARGGECVWEGVVCV